MYKFGTQYTKILNTVNKHLVLCALETIKKSKIDISIPEWGGFRDAEYQFKLYKKKWSKADGTTIKSNHQLTDDNNKSLALDLCSYYNGDQNWNKERLCYIAGLMLSTFDELKKDGEIPEDIYIHWGGFWKSDDDGLGWDLPHYEIRNKPQKIYIK